MATNDSGMRDSVRAVVNPTDLDDDELTDIDGNPNTDEIARRNTEQPGPMPERPAASASKAKWVDYVVAWGANRDHVLGESEHWDDERGEYVKAPALTREQLIELADSLGG